jgi:hypothetical protein
MHINKLKVWCLTEHMGNLTLTSTATCSAVTCFSGAARKPSLATAGPHCKWDTQTTANVAQDASKLQISCQMLYDTPPQTAGNCCDTNNAKLSASAQATR